MFAELVNCLLRGMKGLVAHFILKGNVQPTFKKARRVGYAGLSKRFRVTGVVKTVGGTGGWRLP